MQQTSKLNAVNTTHISDRYNVFDFSGRPVLCDFLSIFDTAYKFNLNETFSGKYIFKLLLLMLLNK